MKKIEWQTMEPVFPETAFMVMMFVGRKKGIEIIVPMDLIYDTVKQAIMAVERNEKMLLKKYKNKVFGLAVFEMKLRKRIELKKEYWGKGVHRGNDYFMKINEFMKNPGLYQYLVLPRSYDDKLKEWRNAVSLPFFISDDDTKMINYFKTSDEGVDERAKWAATYTTGKEFGINWETKAIKEVDNTPIIDKETLAN
ncbi:MAG: hypothetical protein NTY75_00875 [Candidatus Shapirobacteria bacterium]|nr:hypothetical protein [Candidatus Shapirobacteria bacterium]